MQVETHFDSVTDLFIFVFFVHFVVKLCLC
jgi:hypothetical protein